MDRILAFLTDRTASIRRDLTLLVIVFATLCFQMLGRFPLMEPDEGRYSEIPREMLERCDFITPTLNYVKYFEKPPLLYWINSISFSVFGQNEFAARFPCALAGLLTILFTYWLGRELMGRRVGLLGAVILGTSAGFVPQARISLTDMPLTFCLTLCLGSFILAVRERGAQKGLYYYLFYAGAALAVLAKGLIGILFPGAIVFLFLLLRRRWDLLREMRLLTGIPLFLLIAAPWFILVSMRNPEFARFFFIHEHFERFLTKVHGRYQPLWFFIPVLLGTMLPWSFFIPVALRDAWQDRKKEQGEVLTWLAIWAIFIFLFFSKSDSKLVPYILPIFPPLALMVARSFSAAIDHGVAPAKVYRRILAVVLFLAALALPVYTILSKKDDLGLPDAIVLGSIFLAEALLVWKMQKGKDIPLLILGLVVGNVLVVVVSGALVYSHLAMTKTSKTLALKVRELAAPGDFVASLGYNQSLPFYARRRTVVVGNMGELEFGRRQGDQSQWFMDQKRFLEIWEGERKVFLVLGKWEQSTLFNGVKTPPRIINENLRSLLVTNK